MEEKNILAETEETLVSGGSKFQPDEIIFVRCPYCGGTDYNCLEERLTPTYHRCVYRCLSCMRVVERFVTLSPDGE